MHFLNEADEVCSIEDGSGYSAYRGNAFEFERENDETDYHIFGEAERTPHLLMVSNSEFTSQTTNENGDLLGDMTADIDTVSIDVSALSFGPEALILQAVFFTLIPSYCIISSSARVVSDGITANSKESRERCVRLPYNDRLKPIRK